MDRSFTFDVRDDALPARPNYAASCMLRSAAAQPFLHLPVRRIFESVVLNWWLPEWLVASGADNWSLGMTTTHTVSLRKARGIS